MTGKVPQKLDESNVDDVFSRELFTGGTLVSWAGNTSSQLPIDLGGQYAEQIVASPSGRWLGVVAWRRLPKGRRSSHVWLVDVDLATARDVTPKARIAGGISFSPDQGYMAYGEDATLTRIELKSQRVIRLQKRDLEVVWDSSSSYAWLPESELLFFGIPHGSAEQRLSLWQSKQDGSSAWVEDRPPRRIGG